MEDLGKEYWSLANAITAFAVAQSLVLAYALGGPAGDRIRSAKSFVTVAMGVAALVYSVAVWFCNHAQVVLLKPDHPPVAECLLAITMAGRIVAIIGYNAFGAWLLHNTGIRSTPPN
jgi:hypothetical protein